MSSNPGKSGGKIFFSRVNFVCWLLFGVRSTPVLPQWHIKDPSHSAKSAGGRLHLNTHTPLTQRSQSGLIMSLSRHSVGTDLETSSLATCQWTLSQSSQLAKPLRTDPGIKSGTNVRELISAFLINDCLFLTIRTIAALVICYLSSRLQRDDAHCRITKDFIWHEYLSIYSPLNICCVSFWIFLLVVKGPVFTDLLHRHDGSEQTEEWKPCFAKSVLPRCGILSAGKWSKHYKWPTSFKWKSWLVVVQPQENASCWCTPSLPPDTCVQTHENEHFILLFPFIYISGHISSRA